MSRRDRWTTRQLLVIGGLTLVLAPPPVVASDESIVPQQVTVVHNQGDPANRVNVVVVGDGYQATEMTQYADDVRQIVDGFFTDPLFKEYQRYVNVYRAQSVHPPTSEQAAAQFAPGCEPGEDDPLKDIALIGCESIKLRQAILDTGLVPDVLVVLTHQRKWDGARGGGGGVWIVRTNFTLANGVLHEFGHAFGKFLDEYDDTQSSFPEAEAELQYVLDAPNVTTKTRREEIKWKHWIDPATPLPTTSTTPDLPGLYEGAANYAFGIYRPTYESRMRAMNRSLSFGPVNNETLVKQIYDKVSPIDQADPADATITLRATETRAFRVVPMQPLTHALTVQWFLDDGLIHGGEAVTLSGPRLSLGTHHLRVEVSDPTSFVRADPQRLLTDTKTWQVVITPPSDPAPSTTLITPVRQGEMLILSWNGNGLLQAAESVTGPWVDLPEARSPYPVAITGAAKFYRLKPAAASASASQNLGKASLPMPGRSVSPASLPMPALRRPPSMRPVRIPQPR